MAHETLQTSIGAGDPPKCQFGILVYFHFIISKPEETHHISESVLCFAQLGTSSAQCFLEFSMHVLGKKKKDF